MKIINSFNSFRNFKKNDLVYEKIFEQALNESIVYYSPRLRSIFKKIKNSDVAQALLDVEGKNIKNDITFIDIDDNTEGYLTFTRMSKALKNLKEIESEQLYDVLSPLETEPNIGHSDHIFTNNTGKILSKDRNPVKITRIINKLVDNKFKPDEIDEFSRKYMAKLTKSGQEFRIVEGEDIAFWYKASNYSEIKGELGNSCMKKSPSYYFDIYTENPNVCRLVILVDLEDEKLLGRALLWKLKSHSPKIKDELYFMDRQYTSDSTDVQRFRDYANKNGWAYKGPNIVFDNNTFYLKMEVKVSGSYDSFPYMDTFKRYSPSSDTLYNDEDSDNIGDYLLNDTGGGYTEIESGTWSDYDEERVPDDYAVYSDPVNSYLHIDRAVEVTLGSRQHRGWYPQDHENIVYSEHYDEYIHVDDSIYSEWYNDHILSDDLVRAITSIDSDDGEPRDIEDVLDDDSDFIYYGSYKKEPWFSVLSHSYSDWDDVEYLSKDLLFSNYKNKLSLNSFKVSLYKITELSDQASEIGFNSNTLLSKNDAIILKCKISEEETFKTDLFDYHRDLEDYLPEYYNYLKLRYKEIDNILIGKQKLIDFEDNEEYINKLKKLSYNIDIRMTEIYDKTYNNNVSIENE